MSNKVNWIRDLTSVAVVATLVGSLSFLPPDTSYGEVVSSGVLRACVPQDYPPLVTSDPERPGFEVELLREAARRMGVALLPVTNAAMAHNFDPRSWSLSRAQCLVIAGGLAATNTTRSFLDTTPPHLETGWVMLTSGPIGDSLAGATIGFYAGTVGRDRIRLSQFLRTHGAATTVVGSLAELAGGLKSGRFDAGVTDALLGGQLAGTEGWSVAWVSELLERDPVAFGLWKGDLTLKRRLVAILGELEREGVTADLAQSYGLVRIDATFAPRPKSGE